jgi:uncharacterized membrane protein
MKTARFAGHHEAREALVLSVAGVTTIMLIANFLLLRVSWAARKSRKRKRLARLPASQLRKAKEKARVS